MSRKLIQQYTLLPKDSTHSIVDIDKFQRKIRDIVNDQRMLVSKREKPAKFEDGELWFDGDSLYISVGGQFMKLAFVSDNSLQGVPQWFSDYLANQEALLKGTGISKSEWSDLGGL
jgi:hypothetical protein